MVEDLNKYEVLIDPGKWNTMYPEQEHIVALTTALEKFKYNSLNLSMSIKISNKKQKGKGE